MKAVLYDKKSNVDRLIYCDVEKPIPNEYELLIEIHSASLNAADYRMIQLGIIPKKKIFGADISGIVESIGKKVSKFKPGDHVIGELSNFGFGGFAQYVAASEKAFVHKPKEISFDEAAALPLASTTALQALRNKGSVEKDNEVLILGSSGGVGTYAIQISKYFGATVTGVCSTNKSEQTKDLGADYTIDYNKVDLSELSTRYDLILGINGNYSLSLCKKLLKPNGRYIMVGGSLSQIFKAIFFGWMMSFGSKKIYSLTAKSSTEDLEFVTKLVLDGRICTLIDRSFELSEASIAMRYLKEEHAKGKVILKIK
jgi:NADPH:quinone reductase-like Zn-dependent oxidoreductase